MATSPYTAENPAAFGPGGFENVAIGPVLASAATIAPTFGCHHVSGTAVISTITPPWNGFMGPLCLIPDGAFSFTTGGNIQAALTAVVNSPIYLEFDGSKWFACTGTYGAAQGALSVYAPYLGIGSQIHDTKAQSTLFLGYMQLPNVLNAASFAINVSHTVPADSNCLGGYTNAVQIGIYTKTGGTLSTIASTAVSFTATNSSNSGSASINGLREVILPFNLQLNPGNYWYGMVFSSSSSGASANFGAGSFSVEMVSVPGNQSALSGLFEAAANTAYKPLFGAGFLSVSTASIPASIAVSDIAYASVTQCPWIIFKNYSSVS